MLKVLENLLLVVALCLLSQASVASSSVCQDRLRDLVVPSLRHVAMNKKDIQVKVVEMASVSPGVYSVRLFAAADSPDNLDKDVSIGWVNLDTNTMHALDVTRDPDHPDLLKVDADKYRNFVSNCLSSSPERSKASCEDANLLAVKEGEGVRKEAASKTVVGHGRLQLYSAPRSACTMRGTFILSGESVNSHVKYKDFTSISYTNTRSGKIFTGWVRSDRLQPSGETAAPQPHD
jgi:hypothetical protein